MLGKKPLLAALMALIILVAGCGAINNMFEEMPGFNRIGESADLGDMPDVEDATPTPTPVVEIIVPTPASDFFHSNQQPRSSIILPDRRLTETERQEWIADYRALGGATANELEIIRLVNTQRRNHGLIEVEPDDGLMMAARFFAQQAYDLRGLYEGGHNFGPYADLPSQGWYPWGASYNIAQAFGASLTWSGGNWASSGEMAAEVLVEAWMSSPGHRDLILFPDHRFMGTGQFPGGISYMYMSDRASSYIAN